MRRVIPVGVFLVACFVSGPPSAVSVADASQRDPDEIVRRADQALARLTTLTAKFTHRVDNPVLEKQTVGSGQLTYRAPGEYRIEYSEPAGDLIVNDGTYVWIFLPSSQPDQVIRQPVDAAVARNPLTFLRDLKSRYVIISTGAEEIEGGLADHLVLSPQQGQSDPDIEIWVDRPTGLLRRVQTTDENGVKTAYTFRDFRPDVSVDEARFRFEPPPDVEVYDP